LRGLSALREMFWRAWPKQNEYFVVIEAQD
jgi:hypothetical protein